MLSVKELEEDINQLGAKLYQCFLDRNITSNTMPEGYYDTLRLYQSKKKELNNLLDDARKLKPAPVIIEKKKKKSEWSVTTTTYERWLKRMSREVDGFLSGARR